MVSQSAMQTIAIVIYRPSSMAFSSVLLVGDINIHLDDDMSTNTIKFNEILDAHNFTQHVQCPTHVDGHLLDVFLTGQSPSYVWKINMLPSGGLSDHSMITDSANLLKDGCDDTVTRCAQSWRSFDLGAFLHDLSQSVLVLLPPSDPDELFTEYYCTLTSLLDQHAPVRRCRTPSRSTAPWYDNECHECKRTTGRLERTYRRSSAEFSVTARHAWRRQFERQRFLFRRKAANYWSITILECRHDTRLLLSKIGLLLEPRTPCQLHHSANDLPAA